MASNVQLLKYSKGQIDRAGELLKRYNGNEEELNQALEILSNFRACHAYPINTFQATLRYKLKALGIESLTSQRLKRTPSILSKLERYDGMRLSQMQDIGGLRAVLPTITDVYNLKRAYDNIKFGHEIKSEKDYIEFPKETGYRSLHMVYKYNNEQNRNYNGLMLELQIRTRLQHSWATAVETVGTFINHSLKSSQGPDEWLSFFELVGNAFAHLEQTNPVPFYAHVSGRETFRKVKLEAKRLKIIEQLNAFRLTVNSVETDKKQGTLHLVTLDIEKREVTIRSFGKNALEEASLAYISEEKLITETNKRQVVLVSSDSLESLKKAYPSYFLDTQEFLSTLENIIK
jgi:putative GTP pyrophosphokinase